MTRREWKREIWAALAMTLENDAGDLGAGYLYEDAQGEPHPAKEIKRMQLAADDVLRMLRKKAL